MTQPPAFPPQGPGMSPADISYGAPAPKINGMALTSMILGIAAFPLMCAFGLGVLLGITALILGIIGLVSINKNPQRYSGKGFAIAGLVLGGVSFLALPLMIALLLPSLGRAKEMANRSTCGANLRMIGTSLMLYSGGNDDCYPVVSQTGGYGLAAAGSGSPASTSDDTIESMYAGRPIPSVTQNMWLLVLRDQVAPKQFVCNSDPANSKPAAITSGGMYMTNFNVGGTPSDLTYSYSFAYPWANDNKHSVGGWWHNTTDLSLPLMADMAPLAGTGSPAATPGAATSGRTANSFNHQRDGQNVAYADGHVAFVKGVDCGPSNDNIYAYSGGIPSATGTAPTGFAPEVGGKGPGDWDVCLVPAADGTSHDRK